MRTCVELITDRVCVPNLHMHTFREASMRRNLQFGGFSVWHPDCGNALRQLTETHRQQRVPSTAMRGDHEQARSRDRLRGE